MHRFAPALALLTLACAPQSAELSNAQVVGFLSAGNSTTLVKNSFNPVDADEYWNIDCRQLSEADEGLRLGSPLDICGSSNWPPAHESWLDQPFRGFRQPLNDAWRGEGVYLNEGDVQVGFHHRMPGGGDFRFAFSFDPDFQPTQCAQQDDGSVALENVDGDWVGEWSKEIDALNERDDLPAFLADAAKRNAGGRLYFLNARAFQFDPDMALGNPDGIWSLPEEWRAGFARGNFVDENLSSRYNRFGAPSLYLAYNEESNAGIAGTPLWYADCDEGQDIDNCAAYRNLRDEAQDVAVEVSEELHLVTPFDASFYSPIVHANAWRPIDGRAPGLDGWVEIAYSWVMLHPDSDPQKGGAIKGSFSIVLDGEDTSSRMIVQGDFDVPKLKREKWGPPDLRVEKAEKAGHVRCQN